MTPEFGPMDIRHRWTLFAIWDSRTVVGASPKAAQNPGSLAERPPPLEFQCKILGSENWGHESGAPMFQGSGRIWSMRQHVLT